MSIVTDGHGERRVDEAPDLTPTGSGPVVVDRLLPVVMPPCASCIHVEVCAIRAQLVETDVRIRIPASPHPAIELVVSVATSCAHYLEAAPREPADAVSPAPPAVDPRPAREAPPPRPPRGRIPTSTVAVLTPRQAEIVETIRETGTRAAAAERLGLIYQSVDAALDSIHRKGLLPADLPDLPRRLRRALEDASPSPNVDPEAIAAV